MLQPAMLHNVTHHLLVGHGGPEAIINWRFHAPRKTIGKFFGINQRAPILAPRSHRQARHHAAGGCSPSIAGHYSSGAAAVHLLGKP